MLEVRTKRRTVLIFRCWFIYLVKFKKSNITLVGPSPAPGSWMHRLRRSMPSCRTRRSASFAASLVGALHVFLCFFHADFWHSAEQK